MSKSVGSATSALQAGVGAGRVSRPPLGLPALAGIAASAARWIALYLSLTLFAGWLTYGVFHLLPAGRIGLAVDFLATDVPKIFLLLVGIITAVSVIRSYFTPQRVKAALPGRGQFTATVLAALVRVVTPFCSCSAVPLFIGFVESGLPLAVTFAFPISSAVVNEVALVLLAGLFGWWLAVLYVGLGLTVAIAAANVIGRFHFEDQVEDYVYKVKVGIIDEVQSMVRQRIRDAMVYTADLLGGILPWVLGGIALGALIHGYAPTSLVVRYAGRPNPFAVLIAVLIAIPLYSNAAGTIPIGQALISKGLPIGTALAFMLAVTAISTPETIVLRKVIKPKLIGIFAAAVTAAITPTRYVFSAVV